MNAPVTIEPVHGLSSRLVMRGSERMGILFPPQTSSEPWEIWCGPEWLRNTFASEGEALEALGIVSAQLQEMAA